MSARHRLLLVLLVCSPLLLISGSTAAGVYTSAQAARGHDLYAEECSKCHGETLAGGDDSPQLAGADFMAKWKGKSVGALFSLMQKSMPTDDPGHLSSRQYADLTAYILSANGMPAGDKELSNDAAALAGVTIEAK